jgi:predicted transcriptional regulator
METIDLAIPKWLTPGTAGGQRGQAPSPRKPAIALDLWKPETPKKSQLRRRGPARREILRTEIPGFAAGLRADVVGVTASMASYVKFETGSFEQALAHAEWDDEPFTDDERLAVEAGLAAYARGEFTPLPEVLRWLETEDLSGATAS